MKRSLLIQSNRNKEEQLLVVDHSKISDIEFDNFIEEKYIDVIYVNQFNKHLWKNYTTIEPTQEMKEYKRSIKK